MIEPEFFVIGIPRSGTTWLASLVSAMNPDVMVNHEAIRADFAMDRTACFQPWKAAEYTQERDKTVRNRIKRHRAERYGEITPRCRFFSAELQRLYPSATFVHLVRDPRKAVPSLINYGYYATGGRPHRRVAPDQGKWTIEQRAAWGWAFSHNRIRQHVPEFVRLEDLLSDWQAFEDLCNLLRVTADRQTWEVKREEKKNPARVENVKPYHKWTPRQQREMWAMCREEAACYGYV